MMTQYGIEDVTCDDLPVVSWSEASNSLTAMAAIGKYAVLIEPKGWFHPRTSRSPSGLDRSDET